jgi:hypothetical protein
LYKWTFVHTGMINLLMLTEILQKNCYIWITCRWGKLASHFFTALWTYKWIFLFSSFINTWLTSPLAQFLLL